MKKILGIFQRKKSNMSLNTVLTLLVNSFVTYRNRVDIFKAGFVPQRIVMEDFWYINSLDILSYYKKYMKKPYSLLCEWYIVGESFEKRRKRLLGGILRIYNTKIDLSRLLLLALKFNTGFLSVLQPYLSQKNIDDVIYRLSAFLPGTIDSLRIVIKTAKSKGYKTDLTQSIKRVCDAQRYDLVVELIGEAK